MSNNISERLASYKQLQKEIIMVDEHLETQRKIFEKQQQEMLNLQYQKINAANSLEGATVRLGDLIKELSILSGIPKENITVDITSLLSYYGKYSKFELDSMLANDNYNNIKNDQNILNITISGNQGTNDIFYSEILVPFTFDAIQFDGKPMHEHMDVVVKKDIEGKIYTAYTVKEKIKNIIVTIPLEYLTYGESKTWYPADMFTTAIINCETKTNSKRNIPTKKKTK